MTPDLPNIDELDSNQLIAVRNAVDARLEKIRTSLIDQAERLGLIVTSGNGKRKRKPRNHPKEQE